MGAFWRALLIFGYSWALATVTDPNADTVDSLNVTSYVGAAFTPAVGDLLVAGVQTSGSAEPAAAGAMTDDQSGTYTLAGTANRSGNASTIYIFVRDQAVASAVAHTQTFTCTGDAATGCLQVPQRVAGMSKYGATAIKQFKANSGIAAGTAPAVTFDAACDTNNPTILVLGTATNPAGMTEPTSWTEAADIGTGSPAQGLEVAYRDSGHTTGAITYGSTNAGSTGLAAVELDASGVGPSQGAATGTFAFAGSATGARVSSGASAGTDTWSGSATGARASAGLASGSDTWSGLATGSAPGGIPAGAAIGTWALTGAASGASSRSGLVAGAHTWAGSATGTAPAVVSGPPLVVARVGPLVGGGAAGVVLTVAQEGAKAGGAAAGVILLLSRQGPSATVGLASGSHTWSGLATGAAPGGFSPLDIAGLLYWFKADALALSDTDPVATWADSSGNGRDAVQATAGNRPTYRTSVLNGKPVVRFNGTTHSLATALFATEAQPNTLFLVFARVAFAAAATVVSGRDQNNHHAIRVAGSSSNKLTYNSPDDKNDGAIVAGQFYVVSARFEGASSKLFKDGVDVTPVGDPGAQAFVGVTLGSAYTQASNFFDGDIAEYAFYSSALSDVDRRAVEAYLGTKYGIPVT